MSVEYVKGDLLSFSQWNCALQCVNAQGVMGSGLAKSFRDRWPAVYTVYREAYEAGELDLGTFTVAEVEPGKRVINLVGQTFYRKDPADKTRYASYDAVYSGMETLRAALQDAMEAGRGPYSLGIPLKLASDRAGASWPVIDSMIHDIWAGSSIKTYIVELPDTTLKPTTHAPIHS